MRVVARDVGKDWKAGTVTCLNPLKVKLDIELSGCSWDEVEPMTEDNKPGAAVLKSFQKQIAADAQKVLQEAKDEALQNLKAAIAGLQLLAKLESPTPEAFKEAKTRVAQAMKAAQEKGVSKEELIIASKAREEEEKKEEAIKPENKGKKIKKPPPVVEFVNAAVGEAVKAAAVAAKEEGKTIPDIIKAAVEAASKVEGVTQEDMKNAKKAGAAAGLDGDSSTSSSSSEDEAEEEKEISETDKQKAARDGIAAVFYFDAKNSGIEGRKYDMVSKEDLEKAKAPPPPPPPPPGAKAAPGGPKAGGPPAPAPVGLQAGKAAAAPAPAKPKPAAVPLSLGGVMAISPSSLAPKVDVAAAAAAAAAKLQEKEEAKDGKDGAKAPDIDLAAAAAAAAKLLGGGGAKKPEEAAAETKAPEVDLAAAAAAAAAKLNVAPAAGSLPLID